MRIDRLVLARYGHLTDLELDFPADAKLHVVLGANEAGKSTALAAIADALYGFPLRTNHAFLHDRRDLRLDIALATRGTQGQFTRLKRNKDDLLGDDGKPIPETAIEAFRGATSRASFERMFGLSGASLRKGGAEILAGGGDVGQTIFQSSTGLHGVPAILDSLREKADALYTTRRTASRAIYQASDAFKAAQKDLDARAVRPDAYESLRANHDRLQTMQTEDAARESSLGVERRRLERIRRTLPPLRERTGLLAELLGLGDVAPLPDDAERRREEAFVERQKAADAIERDRKRREDIAARRDALVVDEALLRDAETIEALARDLSKIDGAHADRAQQAIVAGQHEAAIAAAARELGLSATPAETVARMPAALARTALRRCVTAHAAITDRLAACTRAHDDAAREAEARAVAFASLPVPEDQAELRRAIDAVKAEGRLDADLDQARAACETSRRTLERALASLPRWTGDAAALARIPVVATAAIRSHAETIAAAESASRDASREQVRAAAELGDTEARLGALQAGGALPTDEAIAALRGRRDAAWRLIRRHHVEAGAAPTPGECAALGIVPPLADAFEKLGRDADALVDRRASESERVLAFRDATALRERQRKAVAQADAAVATSQAALAAAQAAWRAAWSATGVEPGTPGEMTEWIGHRKTVLDALAQTEAAEHEIAGRERRHHAARARLAPFAPGAFTSLAPMLEAAEARHAAADAALRHYREAEAALRQIRESMEKAGRSRDEARAAHAVWAAEWTGALAPLHLPDATDPADAETALALWERIAAESQKWDAARARVAEMSASIDAFATKLALVSKQADDPRAVVPVLARRLAEAQSANADRQRLTLDLRHLDDAMAQTGERHASAASGLAALCRLAGVADETELPAAIERARRATRLRLDLERCEQTLRAQGDGLDIGALDADARDADLDAVAARLDEIEREAAGLRERHQGRARELAEVDAGLARMAEGLDAAEAAQRMEAHAADAASVAQRYVRLRLGAELLKAGLDRFRREQQDPLLRRAGEHFRTLTGGRYERLEVAEGDGGEHTIDAMQHDGRRVPVRNLSEGASDQLYLALRIAAIEAHARATDPLPLIADDLLVHFDDTRARAGLAVLRDLGATTQTILFTHHDHVASMAEAAGAHLLRLPQP